MKKTTWRYVGLALLLVLLWMLGIYMRREVLTQQTRSLGATEAPFLMESALQYRMTRMVHDTGTLPKVDEKVQVPQGVNMRETYSVGAEWIYAFFAKRLPEKWSLVSRIRWVSTALFCLAIPFAALWAGVKYGSVLSGAVTGLFLAVSPAFAVRSSGLELSRENLAIPFFTFFFLAEEFTSTVSAGWKKTCWAGLAALSLALAQCFWDLTQYITGLWIVWSLIQSLMEQKEEAHKKQFLTFILFSQIAVSFLNPYLRAHHFFFSPVLALVVTRTIIAYFPSLRSKGKILLLTVLISLIWFGLGKLFVENYSHFGELLFAKIRFLNEKPLDPSLLTYSQRIMWTPALNSSTWQLTKAYFPLTLYLLGLAVLRLVWGIKHGRFCFQPEFFFAGFTLVIYVFFFRFHVFLILFISVCMGILFALHNRKATIWGRWILPVSCIILFIGVESYFLLFFEPKPAGSQSAEKQQLQQFMKAMGANTSLAKGNRWGRPGAFYGYLDSLVAELEKLPSESPILANFGISASILAQTEMPILLHPKFETPGIRERVETFYENLFLKPEKDLRDWAVFLGAKYYVHSNGNFSDLNVVNSPRYMVDAIEPPADAAIHFLENEPERAEWFQPLYSNRKYRIYKIITPLDEEWAERLTRLAIMAYESGDIETARKRSLEALSYHWKYAPAQQVYRVALSQPVR